MATYDGAAFRLMIQPGLSNDSMTAIVGETTSSLNLACDALEVTNKASAWKQYIAGNRGATISATLYADDDDKMQKDALDGLMKGQKVYFSLFKSPRKNLDNIEVAYDGEAIITSIGFTCSSGAVATRDITLQVSDELTHYQDV